MKKKIRDLVYADLGREVSCDGPGRSHVVGVLEHFEFTLSQQDSTIWVGSTPGEAGDSLTSRVGLDDDIDIQ